MKRHLSIKSLSYFIGIGKELPDMAWESCSVLLNKGASGILYAGDIVTGSVSFVFKKNKKVEYITCRIVGKCKAQWRRSAPTIPFIKVYSEKKRILDIQIDEFTEYAGKKVDPEIKVHNIFFTLPVDLPSSFESSIAKVNYYVELKCKTKCSCMVKEVVPFAVHGTVNLNHLEENLTPTYYELVKNFRISGKIALCLKTFSTFSSNQVLPFEIMISNEYRVKITTIKVYLIQKVKYTVSSGYANKEKKICKVESQLGSSNLKELCRLDLEVPTIQPSSIYLTGSMVDISYVFRIKVIFPFHFSLIEEIPATVATLPVIHYDSELSDLAF